MSEEIIILFFIAICNIKPGLLCKTKILLTHSYHDRIKKRQDRILYPGIQIRQKHSMKTCGFLANISPSLSIIVSLLPLYHLPLSWTASHCHLCTLMSPTSPSSFWSSHCVISIHVLTLPHILLHLSHHLYHKDVLPSSPTPSLCLHEPSAVFTFDYFPHLLPLSFTSFIYPFDPSLSLSLLALPLRI